MIIVVARFMTVMGLAIAGVWTKDIVSNPEIDLSQGLFRARDKDNGALSQTLANGLVTVSGTSWRPRIHSGASSV